MTYPRLPETHPDVANPSWRSPAKPHHPQAGSPVTATAHATETNNFSKMRYVGDLARVLSCQRVRPHLPRNHPRRKILLQAGRLDLPRNIMHPANVIHTVLGRALPDSAPRHWAPPQLGQIQMKPCHIPIHITFDKYSTIHATTRPTLTETLFSRHTHLLQLLLTPLLPQRRQFRNRNRRFRHISHVYYRNVMTILVHATSPGPELAHC